MLFPLIQNQFDFFVFATRPDEDLTLNLVKGKLIDEWEKQKNRADFELTETALQISKAKSAG